MALINCSHCNHKVSSDALICPNCSKPIQVLSDRLCENCNERLPKQKRKCPKCGSINSINNSKQKTGNMNKSNLTLSSILMLVIGAVLMYFVYPYFSPVAETKIKYSIDDAKVERINGFYIFVESTPFNQNYTVIETMEGEGLFDMIGSLGIGKEKIGKVLENIFVKGTENINFHEQLEKMTEQVKAKHKNAQGLIFSNRIKKCEVITFN